jgi:hypothetical protein
MRTAALVMCGAVAACSAAKADPSRAYEHAIRCEMLTGIIGASHPGLSRSDVQAYLAGHDKYAASAAQLGQQLGKTALGIDEDRARFVGDMKAKAACDLNSLDPFIAESRVCAGLS